MAYRAVGPADAAYVTSVIERAFADDPVWGPALRCSDGTPIGLTPYWRLFVDGAMRFGTAHISADGAAVATWLPPGEDELSDAQLEDLERYVARHLDPPAVAALHELFARFEACRASRPPHYYLSLLATHAQHRGRGRGQQLLAEGLARWDVEGAPSYLESTNPANDHRYARAGFVADGEFPTVRNASSVTVMWRPARLPG
jgi:GNAT superfamily N-acetyltransferase